MQETNNAHNLKDCDSTLDILGAKVEKVVEESGLSKYMTVNYRGGYPTEILGIKEDWYWMPTKMMAQILPLVRIGMSKKHIYELISYYTDSAGHKQDSYKTIEVIFEINKRGLDFDKFMETFKKIWDASGNY